MKRFVACVTAMTLVFSMFGTPAMAASSSLASDSKLESSNDASGQSDDPIFDQERVGDISANGAEEGDAQDSPESDENSTQIDLSGKVSESSEEDGVDLDAVIAEEVEEEQPMSFLDMIIDFFTGGSRSARAASTASLGGSFTSQSPAAVKAMNDDITLSLSPGNYSAVFAPKPTSDAEYYAEIDGIQPGTYTVTATSKHHGTYVHENVNFEAGERLLFSLVDSMLSPAIDSNNMNDPERMTGLLPYGDFNEDGKVDSTDAQKISDESAKKSTSGIYDLNGDGVIDLSDIQIFATTVNKSAKANKIRVIRDASQMDVTVIEGTSVSATDTTDPDEALESLFKDDGKTVTFTPTENTLPEGGPYPITTDNPVEVAIDAKGTHASAVVIQSPTGDNGKPSNMPTSGTASVVINDNGEKIVVNFPITNPPSKSSDQSDLFPKATCGFDPKTGQLTIDFGEKVDIDTVGLSITSTSGPDTSKLDIEKIEFLSDGEDREVPPTLTTPTSFAAETSNKKIELSWDAQDNATGYQVQIQLGDEVYTLSAAGTNLIITKFGDAALENDTEYTLRVRTVSNNTYSDWSKDIYATPAYKEAPGAPAAPELTSGYSEITAAWKAVDNADYYTLYYKPASAKEYQSKKVEGTKTIILGLKRGTSYTFYLTASNDYGESESGPMKSSTTINVNVKVPWFYLINRTVQNATQHPMSETISYATIPNDVENADSNRVVDGDYDTYFELPEGEVPSVDNGPTVAFKEKHTINSFAITTYLGANYSTSITNVYVRINNHTKLAMADGVTWEPVVTRNGSTENAYNTILVTLPEAYEVEEISVNFQRNEDAPVTISELAFYDYCSYSDEIKALFKDDLHMELAEGVTREQIEQLKETVNTPDSLSSTSTNAAELHFDIDMYNAELDAALELLHEGDYEPVAIDPTIYAGDTAVNGVNAWQPLGVAVQAGDTIKVYVGAEGGELGEPTNLRLIATQMNGTADSFYSTIGANLNVGMNSLVVPDMGTQKEHGGSLYVEYTSSSPDKTYGIHVIGGTRIPVLDLHNIEGDTQSDIDTERMDRIEKYIASLEKHVGELSTTHSHAGHKTGSILNGYEERTCIANATEIITQYTTFSIPATQFKATIDALKADEDVTDVIDTLNMRLGYSDDMMEILYQHKGLFNTSDAANADVVAKYGENNTLPKARQNIRYMQVPTGTMYASKNHIGINWNDTKTKVLPEGVIAGGANDWYKIGSYFDWDYLHELGHQLLQPEYGIEEVTNNYYAQLLTSHDNNESASFSYDEVYNKVSSGVKGPLQGSVATALYWQLHLAYDTGYSYKTYNTAADQMANLVFARIDAYARNPEMAPSGLSLEGADKDNALMRLAIAATGKNNLAFFEAWGLTPDATTTAYANKFEREDRAIQYITDDSRRATLRSPLKSSDLVISGETQAVQNESNPAKVDIVDIGLRDGYVLTDMLGFEIYRGVGSNRTLVGFVKAGETSFTDTLPDAQRYNYFVRAVDKHLTRSQEERVNRGTSIAGPATHALLNKANWSVSSTMIDPDEELVPAGSGTSNLCVYEDQVAVASVIDDDYGTTFNGVMPEEELAEFKNTAVEDVMKRTGDYPSVTIALNDVVDICGIVYTPGIHKENSFKNLWVQTSLDGVNWTTVALKSITQDAFKGNETLTVYFDRATALPGVTGTGVATSKLHFQKASYVRLTEFGANDGTISVAEIDVLTSVGDSISFLDEDSNYGIGILNHDLVVNEGDEDAQTIPEGSLVFIGTFVGSPDVTEIALYDQDDNELVNDFGNAAAIAMMAPNVNSSDFAAKANGVWIAYFQPGSWESSVTDWSQVYAELYRAEGSDGDGVLMASTASVKMPANSEGRPFGVDVNL